MNVYDEVESPAGPFWNPIWYRFGAVTYSAVMYTRSTIAEPPEHRYPPDRQLAEITVPYTRAMFYSPHKGWIPEYRLYYGTTHWVMDVVTGPDEKPWYKIKDEINSVMLAVPSEHLRFVTDEELQPLSPDVPLGKKRIEISIMFQRLRAYEYDNLVFETKISSGGLTPIGTYHIQTKMPSKHMGNGYVTSDIHAYELVGVPWNCFFEMEKGIATHGTYWHTNFGTPMSAGCINMTWRTRSGFTGGLRRSRPGRLAKTRFRHAHHTY